MPAMKQPCGVEDFFRVCGVYSEMANVEVHLVPCSLKMVKNVVPCSMFHMML